MGSVTKLQKAAPPAPPSPARLKLAERLAELQAAEATLAALSAALDWDGVASVGVRNAQDRLDAAHAALASARQRAADNLLMGSTTAAGEIKAAREEIQAAEDALAVATDAKATLKTRVEPAERALFWAKSQRS